MKLEDITHVFCLSCVLMFFCVSSQPGCSPGWFGYQCKYKCRCDNESCDVNGSCIQPYTCQGGWFGPACQYADLAYLTENLTEITDDNDNTCNDANAGDRITIPFNDSFVFTWLRIHVRDQGSDALRDLTVTFNSNTSSVPCPVWKKHSVNKTILNMHCNLSQTINEITLAGPAVPHLCSVYVSGGRNVAVKGAAWQGSEYHETIGGTTVYYDASRAVDGDTRQQFSALSCSSTSNNTPWIVTLPRKRSVHRYVIYNRSDAASYRLIGFRLESFDSWNHSVFVHKDEATVAKPIYTTVHSPLPVRMVVMAVNNSDDVLTLCEVEIYGDSICNPQHYGRDCEHSCNCADNETCFVSTGGCPSGCPAGFIGDACTDECSVGTFGSNCNESCSTSCAPSDQANVSSCDTMTGACLKGCQSGFSGDLCTKGCKNGTFGTNCSQSCSPNCATSDQVNVSSCDTKTGACLKGCQSGFSGDLCSKGCSVGKFGMNCSESCSPKCSPSGQADVSSCDIKTGKCLKGCQSGFSGDTCRESSPKAVVASASLPMNFILGVGGLVSLMFLAAFCVRRKGKSRQTAEGTTSIAHPE